MPNPQIDLNQSTFDEAITYFRQKTAIPTQKWDDLQDEEHDWAFTIAKLTKANLLQDAQELIEKAIQEGKSSDEFKDEFKKKIESKGWVARPLPAGPDDYRYRIIFETNVRRAHAAGRFEQQKQSAKSRPYLMWRHGDSESPRLNHKELDGKVFPIDSVFWDKAYPPCGYGCKCTAISLSDRDLERLGKKVEVPPDPDTIAEKGFKHSAGTSQASQKKDILNKAKARLGPNLYKKITQ